MSHTLKLSNPAVRAKAIRWVNAAPDDMLVVFKEPTRSLDQNALFWSLLGEISKAEPEARKHTPDMWKAIFMRALEYEVQFVIGLDNTPFPVGVRSSQLGVAAMSELIEYVYWYGSQHGVVFKDARERGLE